jgi:hypothetical protein
MTMLVRLYDWPSPPTVVGACAPGLTGDFWISGYGDDDGETYPVVALVRFDDSPIVEGLVIPVGAVWELRAGRLATDDGTSEYLDLRDPALVPDRARRVDIGMHVRALLEQHGHRT